MFPTMVLETTLELMLSMTLVAVLPAPAGEDLPGSRRAHHQDSRQQHRRLQDRLHLRIPPKRNHRILRDVIR